MKNSLIIGFGVWLLLAIIAIPFPYVYLPRFSYTHSDSLLLCQVVIGLFPISLLLSYFAKNLQLSRANQLQTLYVVLSYVLALYLFKYGFDKLFQEQFYFPEPNILHTPLGKLSKDILFWSAMGASFWYNIFMGLIEIIPALLLLHHRTRMFGAFITFGVLLNVWAINMSFDISVKVLSSLLLLNAIYLLSFSWKNYFYFFTGESTQATKKEILLEKKPLIKRMLKGTVIALFCIEVLLPFITRERNENLTSSYLILGETNDDTIFESCKRIHFHSKGWLILESEEQEFEDYKIIHLAKDLFRLEDTDAEILISNDNLQLKESGVIFKIKIREIDLGDFALKRFNPSF
ncbi:MAG TPA: hypothetical protein EYG86_03415 [Crocinitomicaceae bacterium]|nr:hypothetical protein [Crocinitomicaceae bacterium]